MVSRPYALIVEDDRSLAATLQRALQPRCGTVRAAGTLDEACALLDPAPDVVLLDFALADGTSEALFDCLDLLRPLPIVIAMSGAATTEEAFRMSQRGATAFLAKPFDLHRLDEIWTRALKALPELDTRVRRSVGKVPLRSIEELVRQTMVHEAYALSGGSCRGAAKLLSVSRQTLQHMVKRMGVDAVSDDPEAPEPQPESPPGR